MNASIEKKIFAGFAVALVVFLAIGAVTLSSSRRVIAAIERSQGKDSQPFGAEAQQSARLAVITVLAGGTVQLALLGLLYRLASLDIRARRKTEAALRETEEFNLRVLESSGDGINVLALDGRLLSMNPSGERHLATGELPQVLNTPWTELWEPCSIADAQQAVAEAVAGRQGRFTARSSTLLGEGQIGDVIVTPICNAAGSPEKLLAVIRAVADSQIGETKFRALFEHSADAHLLLDDGAILDCNEAAVRLLGHPDKQSLLSRPITDFWPEWQANGERSDERNQEILQEAFDQGFSRSHWRCRRRDGAEFSAEVTLVPIEFQEGHVLLASWRDLSERERADTPLHESEDSFQAFMDFTPAVAFIKDETGRYVFINKPMEQQFGVSLEELRGHTDEEWLPSETARMMAENEHAMLLSGKPSRLVESLPTKDGKMVEWLMLKFPIRTADGRTFLGGVGIDITKQKRAERAAKEREAQFRDLFDEAPVAYHELDPEGRILRVNKTELAMLGYTAEEMVGRKVADFIVDADSEAEILRQLRGAVRLESYQRTFRMKGGKKVPVLMRHKLITGPEGQVSGMRSTLQDISALKRIEEDLREAEEKYRSIFEHAIEGIFQSTPEGSYMSVNPALASIYGYESTEELMRSVTHIALQLYVDPNRRAEFAAIISEKGAVRDFESEVWRKDGTSIWVSERARAVRDADGKLLYYEGTVEDVTARRETEKTIRHARDAALESARLKSQFLANMSHEIRTPMNGIIGMTGLLMDTELSPKQRDFTQTISGSAEALLTIINDVLDFSKIEAGMLAFEELEFDLSSVVEGAVEVLATRAATKGLELASLVHSDVPTGLRGDPGRLRQVLTNLIGNSVKFTEQGEVVVRARLLEATDSEVKLRFTITDSGIGIPPDVQARLFQAFVQADGSTTRKYGGTGLGLAICRQLVEQMHGEIGVESESGKGSTFWFTARLGRNPSASSASQRGAVLRGKRVLVVDDNATSRSILQHHFDAWGLQQEYATSGAEALLILQREAANGKVFDATVIDMQMPGMNGFALARAIKSDPRLHSPKLVVLTALDRHDDGELLRDAGVDAYVAKPVKQSFLFGCLTTVLASDVDSRPLASGLMALAPKAEPLADRTAPLRMLIAEDNVVNQKVALHQLQKLGYTADVVEHGQAALEAIGQKGYDLVFMDCQMPHLDGYAATRELRKREGDTRKTWIVAMTANSLYGDREKCLAAGMDDYVSKPVKMEALASAIRAFTEARKNAAASNPEVERAPTIDLRVIDTFREMDPDSENGLLEGLIDAFVENTPKVLSEAWTALSGQFAPKLAMAAHSLKGSCSNFGAENMREACAQLEKEAGEGNLERAPKLLAEIEQEFENVRLALEHQRSADVAA
ncbi:MAG: domain S-box protein [Chthoniobacter sp.]|jgi:two-component system sensor histidine kinase/response regulator|nr:domain S-box protein [Chthoniobacter sp.]